MSNTLDDLTRLLSRAGFDEDTAGQFISYTKALITEARIEVENHYKSEMGLHDKCVSILKENK